MSRPPLESCKPDKQGGGCAFSSCMSHPFYPLQTYRAIRFKISTPRPPLFLFYSHSAWNARGMTFPPIVRSLSILEKRRTGVEMHPPISEMHRLDSSRVLETRRSDDRISSSRVSFSAGRQREKKRKEKKRKKRESQLHLNQM